MPIYSIKTNVITGAVANTFATVLALKMANVQGNIGRLRKLIAGGAAVAAQDVQVSLKLDRTNNLADGTNTAVNVSTILSNDPNSIASLLNLIGKNHSVEPTTYDGKSGICGVFNSRGAIVLEWARGEGPLWGKNQTLGILAAPGAATAVNFDLGVEWEE